MFFLFAACVYFRGKLRVLFYHPKQVSTQVELASTCNYLPVRLARTYRVKKLSSLTLYTPRVAYRFYSVSRQTILLVKGRPARAYRVKENLQTSHRGLEMVMARFTFIKVIDDKTFFRRIENCQLKRSSLIRPWLFESRFKKREVTLVVVLRLNFLFPG